MEKLHDVVAEVLTLRRQVAAGEVTAAAAREQLRYLLGRQKTEAERAGGQRFVEWYTRAKYAYVALTDEIFLRDKATRDEWKKELLEAAEFRSQRAGEKIFSDIDALQGERGEEPRELARVFLAVLGLGFEGQFRGKPRAAEVLKEYRDKLHRTIFGADPEPIDPEEKFVPAAYRALAGGSSAQLPYLKPWIWALIAVFVLWIGVGQVIWHNATSELEPKIDEVLPVAGGTN